MLKKTISCDDPVIVNFTKTPDLIKRQSPTDKNQIITFNPRVNGKVFLSGNKLVFQPSNPPEYGKSYEATIHLDKLFKDADSKTYQFEIKIRPLQISVVYKNLLPTGDKKSNLAKMSGKIITSGNIDKESLSKAVRATINSKRLHVNIEQGTDNNTFEWSIDSIKRTKKTQQIILTIDQKRFGAEKNKSVSFDIPPANLFSFVNFSVKPKPEPHVVLTFSDRISTTQNLDGLLRFNDGTGLKYIVKENQILVYPNKQLTEIHHLTISKNIKNINGITLDRLYEIKPVFKTVAPQVRFLGNGNILAGKTKWIIPFETINLKAVDVVVFKIYSNNIKQFLQENELGSNSDWSLSRVGEYIFHTKIDLDTLITKPDNKWKSNAIDLTKMIEAEPGAIYRIGFRFKKSYALTSCPVTENEKSTQDSDNTSYYYSDYYYPSGYSWENRNNPCDNSFYNHRHFPDRNFIAGNIGLTVKNHDNNRYTVYTRNLITAEALSNVTVKFYTYYNQLITEAGTNSKGEVSVTLNKSPFLIVAQWKNQFAYTRLKGGSALSYSKFNTKGEKTQKGLKGYIFGERGVWRPGDTLFLTFVLQDIKQTLPPDHPVLMEVKNARDKKVFTKTKTWGVNGFYTFKIPTSQEAPTGIWHAKVTIGNQTFSKSLRVETVLPNRLKIEITTDDDKFAAGRKGTLNLKARWLHGGLASHLKAHVTEIIKKAKTTFKDFKEFTFDDPAKSFNSDEKSVFNDKLDNTGKASMNVILPYGKNLPGAFNLTFSVKVFEPGGRFSIDQKTFRYNAFNQYVGIKPPALSNNYYLETNKEQKFEVVTVDNEGNKISVNGLKVEVYKLDWSWWYSSNNSNLAGYIDQHYLSKIYSTTIDTRNGEGSFAITIKYPNWGRFYVRITDTNGGHSAGTILYFDWPSSYSRGNRKTPGDATLLSLSCDKKQYTVGDKATVSFPGTPNSKALISIEKNNKIIKSWWIETTPGESSFTFDITNEMAPNVYAFVSVIQPHHQTENDLPIRAYGVIPLMVNNPATLLKPVLSVPPEIKPESNYTIKVTEAGKREMTYVLAVVDEGLLDLTHFKTPSLHDIFYKKEALAVKTWDLYDDVNGAFGGRLSQVFAVGGDEDLQEMGKRKVNRFKPVVTFLGPFTLKKGSSGNTHRLFMPNYTGSVRVMLMAGYKGAYGKAEKTIPVKQPLMVLASMPRTLVPGETLDLPVTIFAMENNIKDVTLSATANNLFKINDKKQTVTFNGKGEKIAFVKIETGKKSGTGKVHLTVTSGNNKASYNVTINIRNPNERIYQSKSYSLEAGNTVKAVPQFIDNATGYQLNASVSSIPPINPEQRINYLIRYPYGCVEQTVSSAFPQLFLNQLTELTDEQINDIDQNIQNTIERLGTFQEPSGGFTYWQGGSRISDWGTSYAGHFLLLAKESGYYVPSAMLNKWVNYQQNIADKWKYDKKRYDDLLQSYRLYTLALAGKPDISAMNRMREIRSITTRARLRLAAAYALINKKQIAVQLTENSNTISQINNNYRQNSFGSTIRDEALALETQLLIDEKAKAFKLFKNIADKLGSGNWMSTQTTAFALYAVSLFTHNKQQKDFLFSLKYGDVNKKVNSSKPVYSTGLTPVKGENIKIKNLSDQNLFVTLETSAVPDPGETVNSSNGLQLDIGYFDMNGNMLQASSLPQGKDFFIKIKVSNNTVIHRKNIALTAIFPSGWEILNTRMNGLGTGLKSSATDYTDIRDDRVNLFFDMPNNTTKTFYILLNAAYPGRYFQSPVTVKAMYDNSVGAASGGGMVNVKRE
jgi:uncharacterized protein YfaS (alpha-2-macroglobulin family)